MNARPAIFVLSFVLLVASNKQTVICMSKDDGDFMTARESHTYQIITDQNVRDIADMTDMNHFKSVLNEILIPRVVGTPNHEKVGNYIVNQMRELGWDVTENVFAENTPVFGMLNFKNIIATLNPNADRYLVLACHYDSKYTREHVFVGATDSAVPCTMMINLAKVMAERLNTVKDSPLSLMFIFFDGEEAFRRWGPTDSIYGAKHLASKWHSTQFKNNYTYLDKIDYLVLLDLLGTPDPEFYSYQQASQTWYQRLARAERRLARLQKMENYSTGNDDQKYFRLLTSNAMIEDDHIPFQQRNVRVIHVIPNPFPSVWHTANDNYDVLDFKTIENLNKIFRVFVTEYLHLKP